MVQIPMLGQITSTNAFPKGEWVSLFNGKDLAGWHGMPHFSPIKLAAMSKEERDAKVAEWTADSDLHWSVRNGELVNDGHGAYMTTDEEFGDYELLIDYKTVAQADSGIYLFIMYQMRRFLCHLLNVHSSFRRIHDHILSGRPIQ